MDYATVSYIAQTWGLVLLVVCFVVAFVYALWPGNRDKFKHAAQLPLDGEETERGTETKPSHQKRGQ